MFIVVFYDLIFFFFFQAEDGIRDTSVTGVQTCALPICRRERHAFFLAVARPSWPGSRASIPGQSLRPRSEERRVGKGRSWWGECVLKKKKQDRRSRNGRRKQGCER